MKIKSAQFVASAKDLEACPPSRLPEFAFIGRSNVGKSSLINMLAEKKELAYTSSKPGKTRLINFFKINNVWNLVDLPGYGYAKLSRVQQQAFNRDISGYLTSRENLKHVFLLVDSRIKPQGGDLSFAEWLQHCKIQYSIIFTKTDRNSDIKVENHVRQFMEELEAWKLQPTENFLCSAKTGKGRARILHWIESQLPQKKKAKKKGGGIHLGWMK